MWIWWKSKFKLKDNPVINPHILKNTVKQIRCWSLEIKMKKKTYHVRNLEINNLSVTPGASKGAQKCPRYNKGEPESCQRFLLFVKIFYLIWIQDICDNSSDNDQAIHILYFPALCTFKKSKYLIDQAKLLLYSVFDIKNRECVIDLLFDALTTANKSGCK